jgi:hypothetical protein
VSEQKLTFYNYADTAYNVKMYISQVAYEVRNQNSEVWSGKYKALGVNMVHIHP